MKIKLLTCILLFLTACQSQTLVISPTSTVAPVTSTRPPSAALTPVLSATLVNDIQQTPTSQVEDELCQSAEYLGLAPDYFPNVFHSPSGKWSFVICEKKVGDEITYPFVIFQINGNEPWIIDTDDIEPELVHKYSITTFRPVYWSKDEKNLYVIASLPCPDSFECWVYEDGESLYKLDLEIKKISAILPPYVSLPRYSYAYSLSPDENHLAFVDQVNPSLIHIRNLVSGSEKTVELKGKYLRTGAFVWTPNSQEVAFSSLVKTNGDFFSSIYLYDVSNKSLTTLINEHLGVLFPNTTKLDENKDVMHWYNEDVLYIESIDQGYWHLNIRTKELTPEP